MHNSVKEEQRLNKSHESQGRARRRSNGFEQESRRESEGTQERFNNKNHIPQPSFEPSRDFDSLVHNFVLPSVVPSCSPILLFNPLLLKKPCLGPSCKPSRDSGSLVQSLIPYIFTILFLMAYSTACVRSETWSLRKIFVK